MATPTLTNLNTAEQFRSTTLDLTDMVVTGSDTITVLIGIEAAAGTLDYLPATTGNVQLFGLGEGQYLLEGSETELTTSLANLGFAPTAGYFGTFSMQIAIGNADGNLSGQKRFSFELADGDTITLAGGSDHVFLFKTVVGSASVTGGDSNDSLLVVGADDLTVDFSQAGQQVTSGSPNVTYSGFENLDAADASGAMTVIAASAGSSIKTGAGVDAVTLGAGVDTVETGSGNDTVSGAWTLGDSIVLDAGDDSASFSDVNATVDGGEGLDTLLAPLAAATEFDFGADADQAISSAATVIHFENLDGSGATASLSVSLGTGSTSIRTGAGADSIAFRDVVASVNAGTGRDTLLFDINKLSAPTASTALTINLAAAANTNVITGGALAGASWQNFENLDGSAWDKNLTVIANAAGSIIATGSGLDTITLGAGADNVTSGGGSDRLNGAVGGGDVIDLGAGNDTATFAANATGVARGGADTDTLLYTGAAVTINLATNARFTGFENLSAATAAGVVTFIGVAGTTAVASGVANDVINVAAATGAVTINAGAGSNTIIGGRGADTITLGAGVDKIRGGGGNDVIRGNLSVNDRVLLDAGNDTITLPTTAIAVTVDGGAGSDTLIVRGSAAQTFSLAGADDNGTLAGRYTNFENISGAAATGALNVTGVAGTTSVVTGRGTDVINVAAAAQGVIINAGNGANTITGSAFNDSITLGTGKDIVSAGNGADTVNGALTAGDQVLLLGGNDSFLYRALTAAGTLVDGGTGIDTLQYTGTTAKTFNFAVAADNVATEAGLYKAFENLDASTATGAVTANGAATTTRILTGSGADIIAATSASGGVRVDAGAGNDRITTGSGADTIVYGAGTDAVDAGTGTDELEIGAGAGELVIDFSVAAGSDQVDSTSVYKNFDNLDGAGADSALSVTLGVLSTAVVTGTGDDVVRTGALTSVSGAISLGAGEDSLIVDTTGTSLAGVTLTNVEHLVLANNVDATLSIAQNAVLDSADGNNTVSLSAAGSTSGAAEVEHYRLANGVNDFTLGAADQNVTGGTGNDTVHSDALTALTGSIALGGGADSLVIDSTATDISGATLTAVEAVVLATDVNATMSVAQNALLGAAAGTNTITLSDAGTASGAAQVENYLLADGGNIFTLGAAAQNLTGGSGDDTINSGALASISGTLDGGSGNDILSIDNDAVLSATLSNINSVSLASGVDLTTNLATAALIASAVGTNSVSLTDAGVLVGVAEVETYRLAEGGNDFTLGATAQNVVGGSGDDVINSDTLTSITGTLTGGGGNDVLNIQGSTLLSATLVDIDTITIASNVDLTTIIADNALIGSAAGSNFVTLLDAGTLTGALEIEAYRLADGANSFTLGTASQTVIGGSGDDVVHTGAFTTLTGTYTLDGGDDTVVVDQSGTDLTGATLTAVEHIALASDVDVTVTLAQHALLGAAVGDNSVILSEAGSATGAAAVEDYTLADGSNSFTLGAASQVVFGGSGDDVVHTGTLSAVTSSIILGAGNDSLVVDSTDTNISAAGLSSVESIVLGNDVSATVDDVQNTLLSAAVGTNTVTLSIAATATGMAEVENYQLANGGNSFTLGAAAQNVTGGSGDDAISSGAMTTISGNLDGVSGTDTLTIASSVTLSATLLNIDAVNLANNVAITTTLANNALLSQALGVNTVTLNEAGTASGATDVESYVLAAGGNTFTLGASAQNVTGGSGDDVVHSDALTTFNGTLSLDGGNDRLVVDTTNTDIANASLSAVEAVELANDVSIISNIANNALITSALGSNSVSLSAAGTASGAAEVENYVLAAGTNSFTLGASSQNVTGGSGDDALLSGALATISGDLDGVSGNDTLAIQQSASLSASLSNIDAVTLANNVDLTTTIANNALITTAFGNNIVSLSDAGAASGAAEIESYVLAAGANSFTLGASAQNVTGGNGDDALHTGALTSISGNLDGVSGNDTLAIEQSASLSATLSNIDALSLANNVNLTTTIANNALIGSALGNNTVSLSDAGTASGVAAVESYVLAVGGNTFTLGGSGQNVTGAGGDDVVRTAALSNISGLIDGVSGTDTVAVEQSATLSASLTNIDAVTLASGVNLITSIANNALITSAVGSNDLSLSDAGTASGAAEVENYQLADGANSFTLGATAQNVTGGSGDDVVHTGALTALSGTLSLAAGSDSLVVDTSASNISALNLNAVESVALGNNVNATMSIAQHALLGSASGSNTVTLSDAGTVTGAAAVEAYQLANGANTFTLGANGQDLTGGSSADTVNVVDTQLTGAVLEGAGDRDTLIVSSSAGSASTIGGALSNFELISLTGVANGAIFTAAAGVEEIHAGAGADTLNAAAASTGVSITAGTGADTVTGGSGNDTIDVGVDADVDTVNAGGGSDSVSNFGAGDVINFEGGNDTATYTVVTATVDGGAAVDTLTVIATSGAMTFDFSQVNAQQITAGGTGIYRNFENLAAGAAGVDDALTVTMASTTTAVTTGSGDDTITFRSQAVTVDAGAGADTLIMGGSGVIVVDLSALGDQVSGIGVYGGFENLDGSASAATLVAIASDTTSFIKTGAGNDSLSGGVSLDGGAGNNNITADARTTTVVAGSGNDNLDASSAAQTVTVNLGDGTNAVLGSAHDDTVTLGGGADTINAGAGSDTVSGALSVGDSIDLNADDDSFVYQALADASMVVNAGSGSDTLTVSITSGAMTVDFSSSNDQLAAEAGSYRNFENLAASTASDSLNVTTAASGGHIVTGSGDDDVTMTAVANTTIETGAGDDVINVTAATINGNIDAGGNTATGDTLNVLGGGTLGMSVTAVGIENVSLAVATDFTANALSGLGITGSAGADTITVGAADQQVAAAGGDDLVKVSDALLGATLIISGGAEAVADTLAITTDAAVVDADLAQVTGIEVLQLLIDASDNAQSVILAANAAASGLNTLDASLVAADAITVDTSGFANALTINTAAGDDLIVLGVGGSVVNAGNGANNVTVGAANDGVQNDAITTGSGLDLIKTSDAQLTGNLSLAAGGGSDTLQLTDDASVADVDLAQLTALEIVQLSADAADDAQSVILAANSETAGITTVDALAAGTDDAISLDASAFDNALTVNTAAGDDSIVLGSAGSVVHAGNGANTVTVGATNNGTQDDVITTGTGADLIKTSDSQLTADLSVDAGSGNDTLEVTTDAAVADAELAGLAKVELLKLSANAADDAQSVELGASAMAMGLTSLDLTAVGVDDQLSVDATAFANAILINAGAADDVIVLGTGGAVVNAGDGGNEIFVGAINDGLQDDSITTGNGADIIHVTSAQFTAHLGLAANAGQDSLRVDSDASIVDSDFTLVTGVEILALSADAIDDSHSVTLAGVAVDAGLTTFDTTAVGATDAINLDASAFTSALTINTVGGADVIILGSGGSVLNAGAGDNTVTVGAANDGVLDDAITSAGGADLIKTTDAQLNSNLSVSAGAGSDSLEVTSDASVVDADLAQLLSVETLTLSADANDNAQSVTVASNAMAAGIATVDTTATGSNDAVSIDATGFTDALAVHTGAGADVILLGSGGSVLTAGEGNNTITVGAANDGIQDDHISSGAGDDLIKVADGKLSSNLAITAGTGTDSLQISDDAAVTDSDFTQIAGIEVLQLIADTVDDAQSVVIGSTASGGALSTIDTTSVGADDVISIDAGSFSDALAINSGASDDIVILGSGGSLAQLGDGANVVTVGADNDGTFNDVIATGSGNDLIKSQNAQLSAHLLVNAGSGSDTLEITDDADVSDADLALLAGIEIVKLSGDAADNAQQLSLASAAASAGLQSVDASTAGPNDVITIVAANFDSALTVNTGAGNDVITLGGDGSVVNAGNGANTVTVGAANDGVHDDVITTGNGADVVKTTAAQLSSQLTVNAGGGNDRLQVSTDATIIDADLAQLSNSEILELTADAADDAQSVTLASAAASAGLTTVDTSGAGADDAVTVNASGFANALNVITGAGDDFVTLGAGGSVVNASDGDNTVTVGADNDGVHDDAITTGSGDDQIKTSNAQLSAQLSVNAGAGDDVLEVSTDASIADAALAALLSIESLKLSANAGDDAQSVSLAANAATAGVNTVDASAAGSDDVITVDASGFANALTVTTGGGDDVIILGTGGSVVNAGNGSNTVTVGADNDGVKDDHITTGDGGDLIRSTDAQLSSHLLIAAGNDIDTLEVTDDASVLDANLEQMSGIEVLKLGADAGDNAQSVTVAAHAAAMGLTAIETVTAGADDAITIDAQGFTSTLTIDTTAGDDVVLLGSGGSVVRTNDGADSVTAGAASDDIATGAGDDTIHVTTLTIAAAIAGGANTATGDTLDVSGGGSVVMGASVVQIEKVTLAVATAFTANATAALAITGSAGADTINVGAGDQIVAGAGGNDIVNVSNSQLTSNLFVDGGVDTSGDTLQVTGDADVLDGALANLSNVEILKLSGDAGDNAQSVVLAANAETAGLREFDSTAVGAIDAVTLDASAFDNALSVNTGAGNDVIELGAGGSVVNAGDGANSIIVGAANDGVNDDDITTGNGADLISVLASRLTGSLVVAAGDGVDTLRIIGDATVTDGQLAGLAALEVLQLTTDAGDDGQSISVGAHAASAGVTSIDATLAGADDAITIDAGNFNNALAIDTVGGDDIIVLGTGGSVVDAGNGANTVTVGAANDSSHHDTIVTGSSSDLIKVADAKLGGHLSVTAGGGGDTLEVTDDASVADADLAELAGIETLKLSANASDDTQTVSLDSHAMAMGLTTIDSTSVNSDDTVQLSATNFSNALSYLGGAANEHYFLGTGGSVVSAGDGNNFVFVGAANDGVNDDDITTGTGNDLIQVANALFTSHLSIAMGSGLDQLQVVTDASIVDADFTQAAGVEELLLTGAAADDAQNVVVGANAAAAGLTTIDATGVAAGDDVTIDSSGFANTLSVSTGGSDDVITLGSGGSVVQAGNGANIITVGAANDGASDDAITSGNGDDTFLVSNARLSANLLVAAAGGVDTLVITSDALVVDADFSQFTGLDIVELTADAGDDAQSVTFATAAVLAGISTLDASLVDASDTISVDASAYTQDLTIILHAGIDDVSLGAGNDTLLGGVSAGDIINLGAGNDSFAITTLAAVTIDGGIDLDTLVIGAGAGSRQIDFSNLVDQLSGLGGYLNFENLVAENANGQLSVIAGDGTTSIVTGSKIDQVDAGLADQAVTIATGASGDAIIGSTHNDTIDGGVGDDSIAGGAGNDALTGDAGSDTFVFDHALNASTNVDELSDFVSGSDVFQLNLDIFTALQSTDGVLNANNFRSGAGVVANSATQHIILDTTSGSLFYDADGVGGVAHIEFARLAGAHTAVATDFVIG